MNVSRPIGYAVALLALPHGCTPTSYLVGSNQASYKLLQLDSPDTKVYTPYIPVDLQHIPAPYSIHATLSFCRQDQYF